MKAKMYEVTCPECNSKWMVKCETVVNAQSESLLRNKIMEGSLFTRKCSKCGHLMSFYYPFLYCDMDHKFMIALCEKEAKWIRDLDVLEQYADFTKRIVIHEEELREKIRILETGLDDEGIAEVKSRLAKLYLHLHFDAYDNDILWFTSEKGPVGLEKRFYHECRTAGNSFIYIP